MPTEPAVLVLLREHLDREVQGGIAASLLFEALGARGSRVPSSFAEVVDLVHGPLRARLVARLGEARAKDVVSALERALRLAELPTQQLVAAPRRPFDDETTRTLTRVAGTMSIVVIAGTTALASRTAAVLDAARVAILPIRGEHELARIPAGVHLALIDGTDLAPAPAALVARALASVPLALVWGSDAPGAESILSALENARVPTMGFARRDRVDPMIDVLRSRLDTAHLPPPWLS